MILNRLEEENKDLLKNKVKVILGLSGGPDSVFLFHFLKKLHTNNKIELICAHLDHQWREESEADLIFCKNLSEKENIKFISQKADDLKINAKFNGSQEEKARVLRHTFLKNILKSEKADLIALGHHLQDQQETFLWRIMRGTTLTGLTCMKKLTPPYIRPILNLDKKDILEYLKKHQIKYLVDRTNESEKYLRNKIRKHVIPQIIKCDARFNKKFASTLIFLQKEDEFLQKISNNIFHKIFTYSKNKYIGKLQEFKNLDEVLQKRIIIIWLTKQNLKFNLSNNYLNEIIKYLKSQKGGFHQISNNFKIIKKQKSFWIDQNNK